MYLVFSGPEISGGGGHDFVASFSNLSGDDLQEATDKAKDEVKEGDQDWSHVFDTDKGDIVYDTDNDMNLYTEEEQEERQKQYG